MKPDTEGRLFSRDDPILARAVHETARKAYLLAGLRGFTGVVLEPRPRNAVAPDQVTGVCDGVGWGTQAKITLFLPSRVWLHSVVAVLLHEVAHSLVPAGSKTHTADFAKMEAELAKIRFGIAIKPDLERPSQTCLRVERQLRERRLRLARDGGFLWARKKR